MVMPISYGRSMVQDQRYGSSDPNERFSTLEERISKHSIFFKGSHLLPPRCFLWMLSLCACVLREMVNSERKTWGYQIYLYQCVLLGLYGSY